MTYIDLMNRFHRFKRQYKFSHLEVHIWLELAQFWNEAGRPDFVTLTERSLCGLANTTLSKLKEACNFFREIGLIEVRRTESKRGCRFYLAPNCPGTDAGTKTDASSAHPQTPAHLTQNARKKGSKKGWKTGSFLPGKPSGTKAFTMPQRREEKSREEDLGFHPQEFFQELLPNRADSLEPLIAHFGEHFSLVAEYLGGRPETHGRVRQSPQPVTEIIGIAQEHWNDFLAWKRRKLRGSC